MVRITEELVRRRSEHNEGEISTLEEISLHQENIDKIECLDRWCRHLKILFLQSNLIPKIENVSKLKKLEYLNLALNNVERIENLEGCESLHKLDLTVNFIGELTSVENLKNNIHLEILYLTGNPCTNFEGYRLYVIATLPQLKILDGQEIERSEQIVAAQQYEQIKNNILHHENEYKAKRRAQKEEALQRIQAEEQQFADLTEEERLKKFWSQVSDHSPETRQQIAAQVLRQQKEKNKVKDDLTKPPKRTFRLFNKDGEPLNVNEVKIPFQLTDDEHTNCLVLDISVYKYLDTALLDVDLHPTYVKVLIKGKVLQIVFPEEIKTESSTAQRSQITGHLVLLMPKVNGNIKPRKQANLKHTAAYTATNRRELLEIGRADDVDCSNICAQSRNKQHSSSAEVQQCEQFVDNADVPPLE